MGKYVYMVPWDRMKPLIRTNVDVEMTKECVVDYDGINQENERERGFFQDVGHVFISSNPVETNRARLTKIMELYDTHLAGIHKVCGDKLRSSKFCELTILEEVSDRKDQLRIVSEVIKRV